MERFFYNELINFSSPSQYNSESPEANIIVGFDELCELKAVKNIKRLIISGGNAECADFSSLYMHSEIKALMLDYYETEAIGKWSIDLSNFCHLELLVSNSSMNYSNINNAKTLKALLVKRWYNIDLSCIAEIPIESLVISNGLSCIGKYDNSHLKSMSISYSSLKKIAPISLLNNLEVLELDHCSKIEDWNHVQSSSLKVLLALGNNHINSLSFIKMLPKLSSLVFEGTIDDCDISCAKRLKRCFIKPHKKQYNCKRSELNSNPMIKTSIDIESNIDYFKNRNI